MRVYSIKQHSWYNERAADFMQEYELKHITITTNENVQMCEKMTERSERLVDYPSVQTITESTLLLIQSHHNKTMHSSVKASQQVRA